VQSTHILREVEIEKTGRVMQVAGIFDLDLEAKSKEEWTVNLSLPESWNIGLIVGPSGCGKSTILHEFFGDFIKNDFDWSKTKSIVDGFPSGMSVKDVTGFLSSVGLSSPPVWVRPFHVLSNGEKFRASMARAIAETENVAAIDEFTSVVDRDVAKIGSYAVQKAVRRNGKQFVFASCHYDIIEWLEPDWIYYPHTGELLVGRYLHRRPEIKLDIFRVETSWWRVFRKHHYLDTSIHKAAQCYVAFWEGVPVAFASFLHFPHPKSKNIKREHRTVCLPDFQGVGIGNALSNAIAQHCLDNGFRFMSITSHPAMITYRNNSKVWKMITKPTHKGKTMPKENMTTNGSGKGKGKSRRFRATFEYIGANNPHPHVG